MEYLVPEGTPTADIEALIQQRRRLAEEPAEQSVRVFYDTFDWALYSDGLALEHREGATTDSLILSELKGKSDPLVQGPDGTPGFAADLPAGPVRQRILKVCGIRRLLPVARVRTRTRGLRLLNDDDKTVARLAIDESRCTDPATGREAAMAVLLRVLPVRGYDQDQEHLVTLLDAAGLEPAKQPPLLQALAAVGVDPGAYSSKLDYRLDPDERADNVTKSILRGLLDTLLANVEGTRANLDTEFLHDLRVATRRTRSALAQIKDVLPESLVERHKAGFAWLQQVTGPVRDLDVYLLDFDVYQQSLPEALQPHLNPLKEFLLAHYDEEQRRLAEALRSSQFTGLIGDLQAFLDAPVPVDASAPNAPRPIKAVADERIWRMAKRVRQEGRAITDESPPEDLHELRKSCKKLRYLVEFFQSLYPDDDTRELVKLSRNLLDLLGAFQDLEVQADHLRDLAQRMRDEGRVETDTLLAMGALIGNLLTRQEQARVKLMPVLDEYLGRDVQQRFRDLFAAERRGGEDA